MLSWDDTPSVSAMRCSRAWVEINLDAIQHNVCQFRRLLRPTTDLMAVVKADAYGHGAVAVARAAVSAGATWLGVATVPEGIELRQAGLNVPILVMGALHHADEVRALARWQLQPTIVTPKQALVFAEALSDACLPLPVHIKLDTGMSRLGFDWQRAVEFVEFVAGLPALQITNLYSHFATADEADETEMRRQHERFKRAIAMLQRHNRLPARLHLANTAATLSDAAALQYDMVRIGLGLYGLAPSPHLKAVLNLKPALEVKARITHLKPIAAGAGVSYGHRFVAEHPMTIAVVGIGYADGIPRLLSNQMHVLIGDECVRQIGAITMDQLMLDVSDIHGLKEGDIVTLLGASPSHQLTADAWANWVGTISWEILCGFKHRLPRIIPRNNARKLYPAEDSLL
ncbi:alanine racemase [Leptothoe spongobia]|uniref:Alanine racemase n=1 Tax=Leptothoe spongobia TAU-MAC 1115 TaxID=1967444 RepID=A0A947DK39_9CYAN|nr:alanine racemase [Leptothoe spongobia]MBT9317316.1 alanine racemase [Leptothoe spongobia TAU-MAC 1115]